MARESANRKAGGPKAGPTSLYERDFHAWTVRQAGLLRSGRAAEADFANIAEELDTLGRSEVSALRSSYRLILVHLLKLVFQPERRTQSWTATIVRERNKLADILLDNPGLKPMRDDIFARAYPAARREAAAETGLPLKIFPVHAAFTLADIEDHEFWPAPGAGR